MRRCAAASPAHALAERPRRRLRRRLRRSAIGLGAGAGVVLLGGGRGSALYWSLLPALLPWTPAFDTARLVVLFMRAARGDIDLGARAAQRERARARRLVLMPAFRWRQCEGRWSALGREGGSLALCSSARRALRGRGG